MSATDNEDAQLDTIPGLVIVSVGSFADTVEDLCEEHSRGRFFAVHARVHHLVDRGSAVVLPIQTENFFHAGFFLVDEPFYPEVSV